MGNLVDNPFFLCYFHLRYQQRVKMQLLKVSFYYFSYFNLGLPTVS